MDKGTVRGKLGIEFDLSLQKRPQKMLKYQRWECMTLLTQDQ